MSQKPYDKHDVGRVEHIFRRVLHILELIIATITLVVLVSALVLEVYKMGITPDYLGDVHNRLNNILTIVVGLEFVRMLIDMTPGNTLEVLIMATARYIILNHNDPVKLLLGVVCVAGLFATRRFLIRRGEMTEDLVELK